MRNENWVFSDLTFLFIIHLDHPRIGKERDEFCERSRRPLLGLFIRIVVTSQIRIAHWPLRLLTYNGANRPTP